MSMEHTLAGRRIVVIGGTSGIGRAIAVKAPAAGGRVTVGSRAPERAPDLAAAGITTERIDVTSTASIDSFFERLGDIDHVISAAGSGVYGGLAVLSSAEARVVVDTKLWGYYDVLRAAATGISGAGSITLISGGASRKPRASRCSLTMRPGFRFDAPANRTMSPWPPSS